MSENKYRSYLEDDTFHRRYLKNEDEPVGSSFLTKFAVGGAAVVGLAAGMRSAYKAGAFKEPLANLIGMLGKYRRTAAEDYIQGFRNWTNHKLWDEPDLSIGDRLLNAIHLTTKELPQEIQEMRIAREARLAAQGTNPIINERTGLGQELADIEKMNEKFEQRMKKLDSDVAAKEEVRRQRDAAELEFLRSVANKRTFGTTAEKQAAMEKSIGYRQAQVKDIKHLLPAEDQKFLSDYQEKIRRRLGAEDSRFKSFTFDEHVVDADIFIKGMGKLEKHEDIADLRHVKHMFSELMDSVAEDFTIPFVQINPIRMFYANNYTKWKRPPAYAMLNASDFQPLVNNKPGTQLGEDMLFNSGKLMNWDSASGKWVQFSDDTYHLQRADGEGSPIVRYLRKMADIRLMEYNQPGPDADWFTKARYWWQKTADIGLQDEPSTSVKDLGDAIGLVSGMTSKVVDMFSVVRGSEVRQLRKAFGEESEWLAIRNAKTYDQAGSAGSFFKQFVAGRNNLEDVTTNSFFWYGGMERLSATLGQAGLALGMDHLGSGHQILGQLILRRVLPVLAAVEAYKYINYTGEQIFGEEPEDVVAGTFANAQIGAAGIRDQLGITDFFKTAAKLMPGSDFVAELPIPVLTTEGLTPIQLGDFLPLDKSKEELQHYYKDGEEVVRKGRYWEFGNTPFTGSKADYYQPNWYRRITSDWEYTDTMWGSKDEYWANSPFPTLQHPFAPIKHFLLDPYHWDKKHYEDRPYMMTGGISEIEEMPLIGGALNATIGQLLKPTQLMHKDEWDNPEKYKETEGYNKAVAYGLIQEGTAYVGAGGDGGGAAGAGIAASKGVASALTAMADLQGGYGDTLKLPEPLAYVTSSGVVRVMQPTAVYDPRTLNMALDTEGIAKTGQAIDMRMQPYAVPQGDTELINPASINSVMHNLWYNATEVGGFYGFVGKSFVTDGTGLTNSKEEQYAPKIQLSSKMYGYNRTFWDQDLGNIMGDATEIFRRFVPRDEHKNYYNPIDNNMPTWLPGPEYFMDFQHGDPYVKVKKGEMRLPGQSYEKLYGIDTEKLDSLEIGASLIGYDKAKIIQHWLHRDDIKDDMATFVTKRGTDWHEEWESEMMRSGVAARRETKSRNSSIIGGGKKAYENYYVEGKVEDKNLHIGGFYDVLANHQKGLDWLRKNAVEFTYYSAAIPGTGDSQEGFFNKVEVSKMKKADQEKFFQSLAARSPYALIDPKTRTHKKWESEEMHFENVQQVNFYATKMQTPINYLIHVDMEQENEDGSHPIKVFAFEQNPYLLDYTVQKVQEARKDVHQMMKDGVIGRGDLYSPIDRYRILADVAPYSDQYRAMRAQLSKMDLTDEQRDEVEEINDQIAARKDDIRTYDYRFKTANVKNMTVTVDEVLNNNMFTVKGMKNPIKMAGVYVPSGKDDPRAQQARRILGSVIRPGAAITIAVDADEHNRVNDDTYKSISAVVREGHISNLNKELIERGLAKEKENDYSPTGVHARFAAWQIELGSAWERFAHMDTPLHTKLLQVRSPLEQYERREVYGKNWQDWTHPYNDFIVPWYQNWISHGLSFGGVALATFMGYQFGAKGTRSNPAAGRFGRFIGAAAGFLTSVVGMAYVEANEAATGKTWIPERRKKERELEEYFDTLKYVKNRSLFEYFAEKAMKEEGFDVKAYLAGKGGKGGDHKEQFHQLQQAKRDLKLRNDSKMAEQLLGKSGTQKELMHELNAQINSIQTDRSAHALTPLAAQAIMYQNESEKTLYGYDAGEPLANLLAALPKKDRDYFMKFLKAPEEERSRILGVVPEYMKRPLQAAWGMTPDEKPTLEEYFKNHYLPDADWVGWDPRANLNSVKLKMIKREGLDMSEFNMWMDDEKEAAQVRDDIVPQTMNLHQKGYIVKNKLHDILRGAGLQNLDVEVTPTADHGITMNIDVEQDRRTDVVNQMNKYGYSLV